MPEPVIVAHGGSGIRKVPVNQLTKVELGVWKNFQKKRKPRFEGLKEGTEKGMDFLNQGKSALFAAVETAAFLEELGLFNAGLGSHLRKYKVVRMDVSVMDGRTGNYGALIGLRGVPTPSRVAYKLLEEYGMKILHGTFTTKYAKKHGFYNPELFTKKSSLPTDTIGVLALDTYGDLAAIASTGGVWNEISSRVGDSPMIGAGAFAYNDDELGVATCSTGIGEPFVGIVAAHYAGIKVIDDGYHPEVAAKEVIKRLEKRYPNKGKGGILVLNKKGEYGAEYNTKVMQFVKLPHLKPSDCNY